MKRKEPNLGIQGKREPAPVDEVWLDKQDILTRTHISRRTLQTWRSKGIIPFTKIGQKIFYRESDLKELLG